MFDLHRYIDLRKRHSGYFVPITLAIHPLAWLGLGALCGLLLGIAF